MPANEYLPYKRPGAQLTYKATAAVTGKRLLKVTGNRTGGPGLSTDLSNVYQMGPASASTDVVVAVSVYDCANGALGRATALVAGEIGPVTSGAAITAGERVMADANGKVIPWVSESGPVVGVCMNGVGDADLDAEILFMPALLVS